jgi:hypothetical protein
MLSGSLHKTKINLVIKNTLLSLSGSQRLGYRKLLHIAKKKEFFPTEELLIINYITNNIADLSICEIGCGYGQCLFALCKLGYQCEGIEYDEYNISLKIQKELEKYDSIYSNLIFYHGVYPKTQPSKHDILLINDIVSTLSNEIEDEIIQTFLNFKIVFINVRVFTKLRKNDEEKNILLNKIYRLTNILPTHIFGDYYKLSNSSVL